MRNTSQTRPIFYYRAYVWHDGSSKQSGGEQASISQRHLGSDVLTLICFEKNKVWRKGVSGVLHSMCRKLTMMPDYDGLFDCMYYATLCTVSVLHALCQTVSNHNLDAMSVRIRRCGGVCTRTRSPAAQNNTSIIIIVIIGPLMVYLPTIHSDRLCLRDDGPCFHGRF